VASSHEAGKKGALTYFGSRAIADVIQNLNALFHNLSPKATKHESAIIVF
jgi:hypothetical protein